MVNIRVRVQFMETLIVKVRSNASAPGEISSPFPNTDAGFWPTELTLIALAARRASRRFFRDTGDDFQFPSVLATAENCLSGVYDFGPGFRFHGG